MTFKWDTDATYHKPVPQRIDPKIWGPSLLSEPDQAMRNLSRENAKLRLALKEIAKIILRELER